MVTSVKSASHAAGDHKSSGSTRYKLDIDKGVARTSSSEEAVQVLANGDQYALLLSNNTDHRCNATVWIDGSKLGAS